MATEPDEGLRTQADDFASRVARLLDGTVTSDSPVLAWRLGNRMKVAPLQGDEPVPIALTRNRRPVVDLWLQYLCSWDSYEAYLAVDESKVHVCVHEVNEPLLRFEYERSRQDGLDAHIHVHAASTPLGWLAAMTGQPRKPLLWKLHLPVGGRRFRTSLEDVIEMLATEFGIDTNQGWASQLKVSRDEWLGTQTQAATRDMPEQAAEALQELGWSVSPPAEGCH